MYRPVSWAGGGVGKSGGSGGRGSGMGRAGIAGIPDLGADIAAGRAPFNPGDCKKLSAVLPMTPGRAPRLHRVSSHATLMTYSLNTLNASAAAKSPQRTGAARFGHEIGLLSGLLALVVWLLALVSYSAQDPA